MADTRVSNAAAIAACNAIVDLLDAASPTPGYIEIRTGAAPTDVDAAATGTLLGTLTLGDPAFGGAVDVNPGATATAAAITGDTSADTTGTAGYFRAFDGNNLATIQGDITVTGGGGDMELNSVNIVAGVSIDITSWTFTIAEF